MRLFSNFRLLFPGVVVLVNLLVLGLVGHSLYESFTLQKQRAATQTQNLATILEQNLSERLRTIDLTMRAAVDEYHHQILEGGIRPRELSAFLERHQQRLHDLDGLRITDAEGVIRYGHGLSADKPVSLADRDYFIYQRDNPDGGRFLGQPVQSRVSGRWIVAASYRLSDAAGQFSGVLYATIRIDELSRMFAGLEVGKNGSLILRDKDFRLITRYPEIAGEAGMIGNAKTSQEFRDLAGRGVGGATYVADKPSDDVARIYTFRRLADFPWFVIAGLAWDEYLDNWYRQLWRYSLFVLLFIVGSVLLARQVLASWQAQLEMTRELRETSDKLQTVTDYSTDWIYWRAADGKQFRYISPACEMLTGYTQAEFDADPSLLERLIHPDDQAHWQAHLQERRPCDGGEYRIVSKSGEVRWMAHSCRPVFDEQGIFQGTRGSNMDMTPRKQFEQALQAAKDAADRANRAKSQFLAVMSHELRTPMNGIMGMAQMLMMPGLEDSERLDFARTLYQSGQNLQRLLNDILDHSKIEAGRMELDRAAFSPSALLEESAALFSEAAHAKGLAIQCQGNDEGRYFLGDPLRIRQILSNLLNNAIKFSEHGLITLTVNLRLDEKGQNVLHFVVCDQGIGIAESKQAALFKPFSQVDDSFSRRYDGTGLGLAISRNLVDLMGGRIGLSSSVGEGSRFWFELPAEWVKAPVAAATTGFSGTTESLLALSRQHAEPVLVADDSETNRRVLCAMLEKHGFSVDTAHDGRAALDKLLHSGPYALALIGFRMPLMNGIEVTLALRAEEARLGLRPIPVVALTAGLSAEEEARSRAAGIQDFLLKPVNLDNLLAVFERCRAGEPAVPLSALPEARSSLDLSGLLERFGGDREILDSTLEIIRQNLPEDLLSLEKAVLDGDLARAKATAQAISDTANSLLAYPLARCAEQCEHSLEGNSPLSPQVAVGQLKQAGQAFLDALGALERHA